MIEARRRGAGRRVAMRILLLGRTRAEPAFEAWHEMLSSAGVPVDAIALGDLHAVPSVMADTGELLYQAVIQAADGLIDAALDRDQLEALSFAERELGVRRLTAYTYPGPRFGLMSPDHAGSLAGWRASLTPHGRELFGYLSETVPIDTGTWGYLAKPAAGEDFETLLAGPAESSLLGIHRLSDGREQMVQTFDANAAQIHPRLLFAGQLAWLTGGVYVGQHRHYLSLQVDDVLLANFGWDETRHVSDTGLDAQIRMTAGDAERTARWSRDRGIRLDLVCNGTGWRASPSDHPGGERDPLLEALLAHRETFGWISHTYAHLNLDTASRATIEQEIQRNREWARALGIDFEPDTVVTGEHTGLANLAAEPPRAENPHLAAALAAQGIRFIASDASRPYPPGASDPRGRPLEPGRPFQSGTAFAVPRYPTMLGHDVATESQALDRLRSTSQDSSAPASWADAVAAEARRILIRVLGNDPRPHYFHQSNLVAGDADTRDGDPGTSLACQLIDATLNLYQSLILPPASPIVQPTMSQVGRILLRRELWHRALSSGRAGAYLAGPEVVVVNRTATTVEVPLTGTVTGQQTAGWGSGWVSVRPGETRFPRAQGVDRAAEAAGAFSRH